MDEFVEEHRLVGRIAFAVGADHDQKLLDLLEVVRAELAHARQRDRETLLFQAFLHFARQPLGVAGLGAEEDGHVALDRRRGRRARMRVQGQRLPARTCPRSRGTAQTSQVAAEPDHLIGRERGQQLVQDFRLMLVKRAVVDSEGKSTHQFGPAWRRLYPRRPRGRCARFPVIGSSALGCGIAMGRCACSPAFRRNSAQRLDYERNNHGLAS